MSDPVDTDAQGVADVERALLLKDVEFWIALSDIWKRLANDERAVSDRLRAVLENAPHAHGSCLKQSDEGFDDRQPCTCWKADAL